MHAKLQHQKVQEGSPEINHRQPPPRLFHNHTQPTGDNPMFGHPVLREGPLTGLTGPLFACHAFPPQQPYHPDSTAAGDQFGYYLLPVPVTIPPTTHFHEGDAVSPFNMDYPEIDYASHGYEDANSHVSTNLDSLNSR